MRRIIKLKLAQRISLLVIMIVLISIILSITAVGYWSIYHMSNNIKKNVLNIVNISKLSPILIEGLENPSDNGYKIQDFIEKTQAASTDIDIMVVADTEGIRYGHTKEDRLGDFFSAEDHENALKYGQTYVSTGPGTLGDSMRAFAPIKTKEGDILGFVMAGSLLTSVAKAKQQIILIMLLFIALSVTLGLIGAFYVSRTIKRSLLNFEPEDIARLYSENKGILATIREGIIAIDLEGRITLINKQALELIRCGNEDVLGEYITKVFPQSKLPDVIDTKESIFDYQHALKDIIVNSNNIPIINDDKIIGGVSSFRDQTEIIRLSEQVTGVHKIVDSLRATTHEFKNKLHVILGYIECDKLEAAVNYISTVSDDIQNNVSHILKLVKEPTIASLLIGKISRGHELKVDVRLHEDSYFDNQFLMDINSLVVIIGNLIDNALEHLNVVDKKEKIIDILLLEEESLIRLEISDNGLGIVDISLACQKGYTTKDSGLGYGLYLVKENVEKYQGLLGIESIPGKGTTFTIIFNKEGTSIDSSTYRRR
ncbi:sensor histidine kinase [Paenibacillus sp. FSL R10-2734]|uniref:sensor histidine kinase n=1 Tax=Paenibacillus sp. FSL R10-2734 TaxID=2954691 RepID=UPI0030DC00EB